MPGWFDCSTLFAWERPTETQHAPKLLPEKPQNVTESKASASHRTLVTVELLVLILFHVDDIRTILLAQRVNTTFQKTIAESKTLQTKLWFLPNTKPSADPDSSNWSELNPLLSTSPYRTLKFRQIGKYDEIAVTMKWIATSDIGEESWRKMLVADSPNDEVPVMVTVEGYAGHPIEKTLRISRETTVQGLIKMVRRDLMGAASVDGTWRPYFTGHETLFS